MEENNFPNIFDEKYDTTPDPQYKKLERSGSDVIIAGVCSGIAKYSNTDPSIIRLIATLSLILGAWSIAAYLILAYLLPDEKNVEKLSSTEIALQRRVNVRTVVSSFLILAGLYFGLSSIGLFVPWPVFFVYNSFLISFSAIGFGVFLFGKFRDENTILEVSPVEKFYRVKKVKILYGVCSGLSKYFYDSDVTTIRIIFVITTLLTLGLMLIGYFLIVLLTNYEVE
jgi:phage shock protein PspC (stress-responsive transcriptional regulator)